MNLGSDGRVENAAARLATGWSAHPSAVDDTKLAPAQDEPGPMPSRRVVAVGAICDLRPAHAGQENARSFAVSEFLRLDDGQCVILHSDRGFTMRSGTGEALREGETAATIGREVLNVVLPDDDECGQDHPWSWLAELAHDRGIDVTAENLQALGYEVVLTDEVSRWLTS